MNKKIFITLAGLVVLGALVYYFYPTPNKLTPVVQDTTTLAGMQTGNAPWIAETSHLRERLDAIGLPALKVEGQALHIHEHIDIFIGGKPVVIPKNIGVNEADRFISPIHVHDDTAVIHIESPAVQTFTLGQFFDVWGVSFTKNSIGAYQNSGDKILRVFVNGIEVKTDPRLINLEAHQEIVITYGKDSELPNPIPATYKFAQGL